MKRRRLSAERLKVLPVAGKHRRDRRRHLILGCSQHAGGRGGAAAYATVSEDPMLAVSVAAAATHSGAANT